MYVINHSLKQNLKKHFINNLKLLDLINSNSLIEILNEFSSIEEIDEKTMNLLNELEKDYEDYIKGNQINLFNEHIQVNEVS